MLLSVAMDRVITVVHHVVIEVSVLTNECQNAIGMARGKLRKSDPSGTLKEWTTTHICT